MIRHLRTGPLRALPDVELRDLGRINVICGRNDSGKTTLLEAISMPQLRKEGISPPRDFRSVPVSQTVTRHPGSYPARLERYQRAILDALSEKTIWYQTDLESLATPLWNRMMRDPDLQIVLSNQGALDDTFRGMFSTRTRTTLVPARRSPETTLPYSAGALPAPTGTNLVRRLLFLKNQLQTSKHYSFHVELLDAFASITGGYKYDIELHDNAHVSLNFSRDGSSWFHANTCGLGLQEVLLTLYFAMIPEIDVLCIEEPETHLHADVQRRLLHFLASRTDRQFFVTTHSNIFLGSGLSDCIFSTTYQDKSILVSDATTRAAMLSDLGYSVSDNLVADVVVLVEGPSDVQVLDEFGRKRDWSKRFNIRLWPMGGDIMAQLDLSVLTSSFRTVALIDRDPGSARVRRQFQEACARHNVPVHQLERNAIENYFTVDALRSVFPHQVAQDARSLDPDRTVEQQLGFSVKKQNRRIASMMSFEDVRSTDLGEFLVRIEELAGQRA